MTITIELTPEQEERLRAAGVPAEEAGQFAVAAALAALDFPPDAAADPLAVEAIREGLEDLKAGRTVSLEEYRREMQQRHQENAKRQQQPGPA